MTTDRREISEAARREVAKAPAATAAQLDRLQVLFAPAVRAVLAERAAAAAEAAAAAPLENP